MTNSVTDIVDSLRDSRKYRDLSASVLERTASWALARFDGKDTLKAAKRKLHQVYSAYCPPGAIARLRRLVADLPRADDLSFRDACAEILRGHASTAERLPHVENLYPRLWELTGSPTSVLDLACGFHPFALPWMGLASDVDYAPCDLDERLVEQINVFLRRVGRPAIAECRDLLVEPIADQFDVVFLLKSLPCLEQQEPGAGLRLLQSLPGRCVVISFPTASLGGRGKGMRANYWKSIDALGAALNSAPRMLDIPGELVAVFHRAS
jgi:16S rRNA (guanine(1405)-N(7))-methyltransferase